MNWDELFSDRAQVLRPNRLGAIFSSGRNPDTISLAGGIPDPNFLPIDRIKEATDTVLSERGGEALNYGNGQGVDELRAFIAGRMSTDKVKVDPDNNVVITSGSQQGLDLIGRTLLNDGDRVLVRNPTYIGALSAWRSYQLKLEPIFSGSDDVDATMQPRPKLMYFVTDYENPTGEILSLERRQKLVGALAKHQVPAVEDDPYGQLRYDGERVPTLFELDGENNGSGGIGGHVIYAGSFSKVLSPGMRIGWVVADKPFVTKLMEVKRGANLCSSIFDQFVAYEASRDGFLDDYILKLRVWYKERRDAMFAAMEKYFPPGVTFTRPQGGFFVMVTLPEGMDTIELLKIAVERGVVFIPGEAFHITERGGNTLRLSFSHYPPERIDEGIKRLADSIKDLMAERV